MSASRVQMLVRIVRTVAIAVWFGGLLLLGTTVAPLIFRHVPAPTSADAMTLVFLRFDRLAIASGVMLLATEFAHAMRSNRDRFGRVARIALVSLALSFRLIEAVWLAPRIAALHHNGATRGFGQLGETLERLHRGAELTGKLEAVLLLVFIGFLAWSEGNSEVSD